MLRTRREIVESFLSRMNDEGDPVSRRFAQDLLDYAVLAIWQAHPFHDHRLPTDLQVTLAANQRVYPLPSYFGRVVPKTERIPNLTTGRWLQWMTEDEMRAARPLMGTALDQPGIPDMAALSGVVGVSTQPPTTGWALEVVSASASDTTVGVTIEGVRNTGVWDEVSVVLTGTTEVPVGVWATPLVNFSKGYPATLTPPVANQSSEGLVRLRRVAPNQTTVLEELLPWESGKEFPSLLIAPTPVTGGEIVSLPAIRRPKRYTDDSQEVPADWGPAILEEMTCHYRESSGETESAASLPRPLLMRLIGLDNTKQRPSRIRNRPFDPYGILG